MFRIKVGQCPTYLSDCVKHASSRQTKDAVCNQLADSDSFEIPRLRTKFRERAFLTLDYMRGILLFQLHSICIQFLLYCACVIFYCIYITFGQIYIQ
jgi:hypothetical protein